MSIFKTVPDEENARYRKWTGAYKPYDLVKEATIAVIGVLVLGIVLTILFSSPDDPPTTVQSWAKAAPIDFVATAASELDGTSASAAYGPPYNSASDGQHIAFIHLAKWLGVKHPLNPTQDFVIAPLRTMRSTPGLQSAIDAYQSASSAQQAKWTTAYANALAGARQSPDGSVTVPGSGFGPVPAMMSALLSDAQSGGLDGQLLTTKQFFQTDYTKILMFLADDNGAAATLPNGKSLPASANAGYFFNRAASQNLQGGQWGMMNETGQFPGQVWLWLYTFWYQVKPFSDPGSVFGQNADIYVMAIMGILSLCLILVPFFPVVNRIPRWVPVYRLIWKEHYRSSARGASPPAPPAQVASVTTPDRSAVG